MCDYENGANRGNTQLGQPCLCCSFYPTFPVSFCYVTHTHEAHLVQQDDVEIMTFVIEVFNA